ncbi:MAG: 50S ribosomal protein L32 [Planctomycetota bacterium]|nr:MAG: 50S ribosomal protein L32 [Planctomycetota bacterium]
MHPTHRISPGRTRRRRSHHAVAPGQTVQCPNCGSAKSPHRACRNCGYVRPGLTIKTRG